MFCILYTCNYKTKSGQFLNLISKPFAKWGGGMGGLRENENIDPASTSPYADVLIFGGKGGGACKGIEEED